MAPSPSTDRALGATEAGLLLDIADQAIVVGLLGRPPFVPDPDGLPPALNTRSGAFVTLTVEGALNGCIGSIEGGEPLGVSVAHHAWAAAFADPRLPALRPADYAHLVIEVSILSPLTRLAVRSRRDLLARLRAGVDGLVIAAGRRRAVFLPAVWDSLADPVDFLDHLYLKAGLAPGTWPVGMEAFRFTADKIGRPAGPSSDEPVPQPTGRPATG